MPKQPSILANPEYLAITDFKPRRDQPERFDEQTAFYESKLPGVAFMIGGNGAGTSEVSLAKVAKFLLFDQPPPRRDCPYYIISDTYEQVMKVCWKEKLYGHGHIPAAEIDWDRISWYSSKDGWPYRVPLRPWPGRPGKNWVLEFKSYDQGRNNFQAASIGGFMFSEQFPWGLLEEVVARCREYSFNGAKLAEFTPIDPVLSAELEEMLDRGTLPKGWGVFRANTECAMEAGHVSEQWYNDLFGFVSDEMIDTRKIGAFASYQGRIYPRFGPAHLTDKPLEELLAPGMQHRRGIDWGFGEDNAFVCLWGARDGSGHWIIYDEYYSTDQYKTVHDHLREICDRHEWPQLSESYGVTYADPSDPGNIRLASQFNRFEPDYPNISIQNGSNRRHEGIDYLRWLMKPDANGKPRITIHRDNCPKLVQQLKMYRWIRGTDSGRNPTDARPEPLKKNDHTCTIATMPVLTKRGWVSISDLLKGDVVHSGCGWTDVVCGPVKTGVNRDLVRVLFDDGGELLCTPDHELLTDGGWAPASQCKGRFSLRFSQTTAGASKESRIKGRCGVDIRLLRTNRHTTFKDRSTAGRRCFIGESTEISSGRFPPDTTSIILTETGRTTYRQTLSQERHRITRNGIHRLSSQQCVLHSGSREEGVRKSSGMLSQLHQQQPGSTGTLRGKSLSSAQFAASCLRLPICGHMKEDCAHRLARENHQPQLAESAVCAESISRFRQETLIACTALGDVRRIIDVQPAGSDDVYCIATASGSMVWDGGSVVSNCDALRYLVFSDANSTGTTPEGIRRSNEYRRYGIQFDGRGD